MTVGWLSQGEQPKESDEGEGKIIDLTNIGESFEYTLSHAAAVSSTALYVAYKADVVGIKYAIGRIE